ncbi:hypothetical protein J5N97_029748 [Dioscorea zingiberensis]|uniref:O-fucosyltransferase family protein n=1 Tax=Dioscorea zingiberensis TaxID=325984 RepID=A0A9D5H3E5_9LILI|nr:hypothetical protein J5N97_029748 [Dioscorea zingiberensis]
MDLNINRSRWRKRSQRSKPLLLVLLFVPLAVLLFSSYSSKPFKPIFPLSKISQCAAGASDLAGKRFLWYAPHSGFSNQLSELKNAILIAGILNRTLIVPPVLDHHAVALGSCPKFRVLSPSELRAKVWDHIMELIRDRRYVSMADIVDLSSIAYSTVQTIDFRVFASVWRFSLEPYKGSELYIDIHEARKDSKIQLLLNKLEHLPFASEITDAGREFAINRIKEPFLCAQLRLLDGQFKNHWKTTFSAMEQKIQSLETESKLTSPLHIFIMTDLPRSNWTGTYLANLANNPNTYQLYTLSETDEIIEQTTKKLMTAEHGMYSSFLPKREGINLKNKHCDAALPPDILLCIEETICSCASLGFVGTSGSTIAESIELMRRHNDCQQSYAPKL